MEEFNQNQNNSDIQNFDNTNDYNQNFSDNQSGEDIPVWNKVEYSPVEQIEDYKPMKRGLKVFCFVMVGVLLLTMTTGVGYFVGKKIAEKNITSHNYIGQELDVNLAAKPKDTDQLTAAQVYEEVNKSIVGIRVYNEAGKLGEASGVIYSDDGFIVTNDHIYSEIGAAQFKIYMHDGKEYDAVYVAGDVISDLAVLKIETKEDVKFEPAIFGNSNEVVNGEHVVAIGRPGDATDVSSITSGIVSNAKRREQTTSSYTARFIQTDSAINPGSSGGALVNMYGQVIGITSSKVAALDHEGIGFAIPTVTMKRVVEQLVKEGKVIDRAKLGISYTQIDSVTKELNNYKAVGLLVATVSNDSDVDGILKAGDIITHVNGIEITNDDVMLDVIEDCKAGDVITITVLFKDGEQENLDVKLKANIGESSYSSALEERNPSKENEKDKNGSGGSFNFPQGE